MARGPNALSRIRKCEQDLADDRNRVTVSPPGSPVRPIDPAKSVSPTNSVPVVWEYREIDTAGNGPARGECRRSGC